MGVDKAGRVVYNLDMFTVRNISLANSAPIGQLAVNIKTTVSIRGGCLFLCREVKLQTDVKLVCEPNAGLWQL